MDAHCTLVRIYLFVCRRGRLAATAGRQSKNSEPDFTDKEVLTVYLFGLAKKRETVSEIYEYAEDHFSDWFPDLPTQESYNRRLNRLKAIFSPLVEKALEEIDGEGARKNVLRIVDSMPIMLAKGNRASQAKVASERTPDVGYCSSKDTFYHGVKLHAVAEQRGGQLPLLTRAGLTSGSENDLQALRRVLPEITGGVLCGDKAYCDGPLKEQLEGAACRDSGVGPDHSSQKGERAEDAPGSRQALFGGHRPVETTNRVSFQLDRRENGHSTGLKGAFLPGFARACVRSACCCNADSRSQPLIRIIYEHLPAVGRFFHPHTGRSAAGTSTLG